MKIIIPMAGLGTRFKKVADTNPEYIKPKPFIDVKGKPMVRWATGSLLCISHPDTVKNDDQNVMMSDLIFIILKEHDEMYKLEKNLRAIYSNDIRVIVLPHITRGAAETALQAKPYVEPEEEIIITDSDHYFNGADFIAAIRNKNPEVAGIIPVFKARNDGIAKWSYSLLKEPEAKRSQIVRVGEKDADLMNAGAYANIGAYYFTKAKYFFTEAENVIEKNAIVNVAGKNEFYIAPLYENMLENGLRVDAVVLDTVWGLGTPEDLEYFITHN